MFSFLLGKNIENIPDNYTYTWVYVHSSEVLTFTKYIICSFTHIICFVVYLRRIKICCWKANHTTDITLHRVRNYFLCILLHTWHIKKCFKQKFYILMGLYFQSLERSICMISHFLENWCSIYVTHKVWLYEAGMNKN